MRRLCQRRRPRRRWLRWLQERPQLVQAALLRATKLPQEAQHVALGDGAAAGDQNGLDLVLADDAAQALPAGAARLLLQRYTTRLAEIGS